MNFLKSFFKKKKEIEYVNNEDIKTWFITGCSSGIGREICEKLLEEGFNVAATARDISKIEDLKERYGDKVFISILDTTNKEQIEKAVSEAVNYFGNIDVLVNNAGVSSYTNIEEADENNLRSLFEVNFWGYLHTIQTILPHMRTRRKGLIINISSICGLETFMGVTFYCATKHAIEALSSAMNQELKPFNVNTMSVLLSATRTDISKKLQAQIPQIEDYKILYKSRLKDLEENPEYKNAKVSPKKAAAAIIDAAKYVTPPRKLLLGSEAYNLAMNYIRSQKKEFINYQDLTHSVDFN